MQSVEIRQCQEHVAPERFQAAPGVAGAITQNRAAHAIRDARLDFLEAGILASDPLARGKTDAVAAILDRRNQIRQKYGIVLPIPIERRHDGAARGPDTTAHRRRLNRRWPAPDLPQTPSPLPAP